MRKLSFGECFNLSYRLWLFFTGVLLLYTAATHFLSETFQITSLFIGTLLWLIGLTGTAWTLWGKREEDNTTLNLKKEP